MHTRLATLLALLILAPLLHAQKLVGVGKLIQGGVADGEKLVNAYLLPVNRALMTAANNGGLPLSSRPRDDKHFSLSVHYLPVYIPSRDRQFDVRDLSLESVEPASADQTTAQTAFGDSSSIALVSKYGVGNLRYFSIRTQPGSEKKSLPLPYMQLAYSGRIGDARIRLIPPVYIPESDVRIWLAGPEMQLRLNALWPALESLPLDLHIQAGAYVMHARADLNVRPDDATVYLPLTSDAQGPYDDQRIRIDYLGYYAAAYAGKQLGILSVFAGAGINRGHTAFRVLGTYPVFVTVPGALVGIRAKDLTDPVSSATAYSRVKVEVGGRLHLGRFYLQGAYTFAAYGGPSVGIGVRF